MKQLITLMTFCLPITGTVSANPSFHDEKPSTTIHCKRFNDDRHGLRLSPNTKTGNVVVSFTSEKRGKGMVVVLDEAGNTVLKQPVVVAEGKNKININDFNKLAEGYYTVCLNTNHTSYSAPFLLWK